MPSSILEASPIPIYRIGQSGGWWERALAQPLEWKLHWLLRIGVFMEFVGHGVFGVRTKAGWLAFFNVFAIPNDLAWKMMPAVGVIDIAIGLVALFTPRRSILLYMAVWGTFTALLRPAANQGWWEFLERSYNYGGPAALLALHGFGHGMKGWLEPLRSVPRLSPLSAIKFLRAFRLIVALMLIGHGGYGVFLPKANLLGHYAATGLGGLGLPLETWRAGIGFFEIGLGVMALFTARAGYFIFVFAWKLVSESLHVPAGADGALWEVIERGGCYMAPLAGLCLAYSTKVQEGRSSSTMDMRGSGEEDRARPGGSYAPS